MDPEDIRLELYKRRKKITQAQIARNLNCSKMAVSLVIDRRSVSKRIMAAVAEAIDRDKETVFPEYFKKPVNYRTF